MKNKTNFKKIITTGIQFLKFGIVGLLNTLITLSIIFILMKLLHVSYRISNIIGYIFGLSNSFIWNKFWTFKSKIFSAREIILFLLVFLVSFGLQFLILNLLVEIIHINEDLSQIFAMIFYTIINFFGNKYITIKNRERQCQT